MAQQKEIIVIDDDPDFVDAVKTILESADYKVDVAYNTKDGLKALKSKKYDLLILDIMMGRGAEGIIFARKIRKEEDLVNLPVLMITSIRKQTGFFFPGQVEHPEFLPVDELVEKPVDSKVLLKKVSDLIASGETKKKESKSKDKDKESKKDKK